MNHICYIANQGQHYRFPVFQRMSEELHCDFYLGDKVKTPVKSFDYERLSGYKGTLKNRFFGNFYWQSGALKLFFKPYDTYLFTGEPFCLSTWCLLLLAKFSRKRMVAWTHGWYGREGKVKTWMKRCYFSLCTDILVYGEYAIGLMTEAGIPASKMRCIANSLDSDRLLSIRRRLAGDCKSPLTDVTTDVTSTDVFSSHFGNNHPTIIYCGRIQRVKKLDLLLESIKCLQETGTPVNLVIVGKDVDGLGLEQQAAQLSIEDSVWFYGPCYDDERLGELFYHAHVCVSPGNIGLTAIHALSFGCPAITHDNFAHQMPEFEAIQPGVTGDFFKEDDTKDLAEKIKAWVTIDDEGRAKVREAAFAEIDRKWNVDHQMEILHQIL